MECRFCSSVQQTLMELFYRNLLAGFTVGEALRKAELTISSLSATSAPYFRAAFGSYGTCHEGMFIRQGVGRMKITTMTILIALALIPIEGGPNHPLQSTPKPQQTLDLILGGPFVFVRESNCLNKTEDCIAVWIPDVASHSKPILFGFEGQFYELERMPADYTLTGMTPSAVSGYNFLYPVTGASSWVIPGKTLHIPPAPKKKPYLILKLPIPKEIVPWNADPLEPSITSPALYAPGKQSFATMTILRYAYDDSNPLVLSSPPAHGSKGLELNLEAPSVGSEHVLLIQVIPQKPDPAGDEHQHSKEAYKGSLQRWV